jgi:hypothetical protein
MGGSRGNVKVIINFFVVCQAVGGTATVFFAGLSGKGMKDVFMLGVYLQMMFCP